MKSIVESIGARLEPHPDSQYKGMLLITEIDQLYFPPDSLKHVIIVLEENFPVVKKHFQDKISPLISEMDINNICLRIVLDYYRRAGFGKQGKFKDMKTVIYRDGTNFAHQVTDIALSCFKTKYPEAFFAPLQEFTGMTKKNLEEYIRGRDEFYNK